MSPLLSVEKLHAGYLGNPVVRDVTMTVAPGEIVALLGPNGAGKSTTLAAIAGLNRPLAGSVRFDGADISRLPAFRVARRGLALVPEDRALFHALTARENLRLAPSRRRLDEEELLAILPELGKCLGRRAGLLSGGEQQMLALGRAIVSRPQLLLIDEMSLGLAPVISERLFAVLRRLATDLQLGILFVEQHIVLALEIADRAYIINHGRIGLHAPAEELRHTPERVRASYLGDGAAQSPAQPARP